MDYKQKQILKNIYDDNDISGEKIVFKQYRNLKEFRYFLLERINPTHKITLYGRLKHKYVKDNHYNKFINVGEIFIYSILLLLFDINIIFFWFAMLSLTVFCVQICLYNNPYEVLKIYVNWYRGKRRERKNCFTC